jgi:hypothetical protein
LVTVNALEFRFAAGAIRTGFVHVYTGVTVVSHKSDLAFGTGWLLRIWMNAFVAILTAK